MQTITKLQEWFKTDEQPTQEQFWEVFDSFWHKNENIPFSAINGLFELLNKVESLENNIPVGVVTNELFNSTINAINKSIENSKQHSPLKFWWNTENKVLSERIAGHYYLLGVYIPFFDKILNAKEPDENYILLIDRYRHKTGTKGANKPKGRSAGFRHEEFSEKMERINEIPIESANLLLDFKQDFYFRNDEILGTGISSRRNRNRASTSAWVDLSFRLRKVKNGETIYETSSLGKVRMILHDKNEFYPNRVISYFETT